MAATPKYLRPYEFAERLHGPTFHTTLWNSRATQRIRFQVLAEMVPLAGRRILDAGCGMGDLLAYLEEVSQPPAHYTGVDALPSLITEARNRYSPAKVGPTQAITPTEFVVGDLVAKPELFATGSPEIVVISGMLNTLAEAEFLATLDRAFAAASRCLLFNFLSTRQPGARIGDGTIVRMDPVRVLEHGFALTTKLIVRHDYYDGKDCTMAWIKSSQ